MVLFLRSTKLYVKEKCTKEIFAIESQNSSTLQCHMQHIEVVYSYFREFIDMVMWKKRKKNMIEARITINEKCLIYHRDSQSSTSLSP